MVLRKRGDIIAKKATTIAIVNQKGGTAKTTTCENLGIGLAMEGKKVLLVDVDQQGSLTISMSWQQPDELPTTLSTLMQKAMNDQPIQPGEGILHHAEGVDLIPANIELAGLEAECLALEHNSTGNHVCDFEAYLRICKKYGKIAYITIRNEHIDDIVVPKMFEYLDKYSMRDCCIVNSFTLATLKSVRNTDTYIMLSYMSDFSTGTAGIKKSFVDQAISLGNCRVGIFAFSSSSDDVSLLESSKEAIQYAIQNDIRVDVAITGNKISIDDLMDYGIVGAQRTVVPLLS